MRTKRSIDAELKQVDRLIARTIRNYRRSKEGRLAQRRLERAALRRAPIDDLRAELIRRGHL